MTHSRRDVLRGGLGGLALAATAGTGALTRAQGAGGRPPFGAAVNQWILPKEEPYRAAIARHCRLVVSESGMKWDQLRPAPDRWDFGPADELVEFARQHNLGMRGHTLLWYDSLPDWARAISSAAQADREIKLTIDRVVERYGAQVGSWDVVNEPIEDLPQRGMRESVWYRALGPGYVDLAFRAARGAAPKAELVLNEYGLETADEGSRVKREGFRRLVRDLMDRGSPVDAIGLQAHLSGDRPIDREGLQALLREFVEMGLKVTVTELDVNDKMMPGPPELIDALVAARAYEFLDTVFAVVRPTAVLTWGITDRHTWMPRWNARPDKLRNRCLPLDENYVAKPFMSVLRHFCDVG
ncbi:endo-1,4-beta-xylanase [Salinarimonas soli]|uniref:Beta-xylanase n=1 Tax=Salinarimonas soli TaxID=1638099 RepID=A0A5B2W0C3_9HYPH|nr:endo-1,4-beta-xylanase [Salinarimonas soli]KAA2244388.1 endo-1,4-beta-xylanase [Salinarimonas soli]